MTVEHSRPAWKQRYKTVVESSGITTTVVLTHDDFGWKLTVWTRGLGIPLVHPEGQPVYRQTYSDLEEAFHAYAGFATEAITTPGAYLEDKATMVPRDIQRQIDGVAAVEEADRVAKQVTKANKRYADDLRGKK